MVRKTKSDAPVAAPTVTVTVESAPVVEKKPKKAKVAAPVVEAPAPVVVEAPVPLSRLPLPRPLLMFPPLPPS